MTVHVLLAGGTGLVGSHVTELLAHCSGVELTGLVRTPRSGRELAIDFEALVADPLGVPLPGRIDVGISCLGTTIRKAKTQASFRRVDHDYVVAVARAARTHGARQFILVSSVGAGGRGFYLTVKGAVERSVEGLGFERVDILRPGLIIGGRGERRSVEKLAQRIAPILDPLLVGGLRRYASIPAASLARTIAGLIGGSEPGVHIHEGVQLSSG